MIENRRWENLEKIENRKHLHEHDTRHLLLSFRLMTTERKNLHKLTASEGLGISISAAHEPVSSAYDDDTARRRIQIVVDMNFIFESFSVYYYSFIILCDPFLKEDLDTVLGCLFNLRFQDY